MIGNEVSTRKEFTFARCLLTRGVTIRENSREVETTKEIIEK